MVIQVKGTLLELTPAIREYVEEKMAPLGKFLKRFEQKGDLQLFVEIARSTKHHHRGDVFYAEATLTVLGNVLRVEHYDADARVAIDVVRDKLKLELERYKEKRTGRDRDTIRK